MTINDEILAIANQLANQGKKPTVALVKTKLAQPAPLPQIISTLKTWQHDPDFTQIKQAEMSNNQVEEHPENVDISALVDQAISPLREEIRELKVLIEQLIHKR
ncbi:hypothetical protein AADZ91_17410 [Colwelliaceae bacterium 6441]